MFNSSKTSESPRKLNNSLLSVNEETVNETSRSFAFPKITSTPRNSIFATPPKSLVLTPRRYSLSEIATPPRNNRRELIRSNSSQSPPGPLLASTKYNINVSTFEDVKSPGLANRIVQYNEEAESEKDQRRHATHQTKYGSLGLFPVVHLFKKKLPLLEQKRRQVTVRVASPDYMKHTPEYNRRIFDGIVKPSGNVLRSPHSSFSENPTSTRSVLDALKEISRKRIHANEELELRGETGKRIRTESEDCVDSNKRVRDDSPLLETTSPTRQVSKKICMYDEYAASRSSMDFLRKPESLVPKRKSISISTITENSKDSKQVKLINAETQTIAEEEPNKIESKEDDNNKDIENEKSEKVETVLKVFDDAPLERIRKNRLAALMGTLVGKDPVLEPKPDYSSILEDETDKSEAADKLDKPLVSILTPTNKSPIKNDKHVRFNIPESISQNSNTVTSTEKIITETTDTVENKKVEDVASPLLSTDSMPVISVASAPIIVSTASLPFNPKSTSNSFPSLFPNKPEVQSTTTNVADSSKPSVVTSSITTSSPPKVGGFKFDIAKPASTVTNSNSFMYDSKNNSTTSISSFGTSLVNATVPSNNKAETKMNNAGEAFPKMTSPFASKVGDTTGPIGKPSFSFGPVSTAPSSNSFNIDVTKTASAPVSNSTASPILFGTTSSTNVGFSTVTTSAKTSFSTFTSVANKNLITSPSVVASNFSGTSASAQPSFGTTLTSVSSFKPPSFGNVNTTNTPNFGMANSAASAPSFGIANTTSAPTFGIASTTTAPTFGNINTTNSAAFGIGNNTNTGGFVTNPTFGNSNAPSNIGFGASATPVNSGFGTSTNVGGFGMSATPVGFGTPTTSSGFGTPTTSGGFGTPTSSAGNNFGSSTTPGFGPFTTSASNMFGISTPTTSSAGFGTNVATALKPMTNSSFTSPNVNSGFGTSVTSGNGFSAPITTGGGFNAGNFGTSTNSATFGTTTTAAFGFGATNTTSVSTFGAPPPTTTVNTGFGTSNTGFGANSGSLFGNPNMPSFGGSSNTPSFGSTSSGSFSDAAFGAVTTTSSVFGPTSTTTPSSFTNDSNNKIFGGPAATFGTPTTSSMFGTTQSPFGGAVTTTASSALPFAFNAKTTANTTFGITNTTSSFGFGSSTAGFGNQQSSSFGAPNKAPVFGNSNVPAFGGSTTATAGFGTTTQQQPFGSTGSVFNKPQSPPNTFGSGQQFSFVQQQNNTNNFGTKTPNQSAGVFTFGPAPAEKPGGFNFGPTDTPKKFDFTGAPAAAPPAFGASFGNVTAPAVPNFGAAAPPAAAGGFSIGAGPPASNRPRPMIKGKRRT
ncbi:unnamed protein product [Psylliodes chrysocephalus]|uniref:Uncharacterized protein n=1 Tax=Psylliodes chrysocephalus TaxID=3402493 RepID=A0A9P0GBA1_9CUCU|nr:unnamed protein product [Psylliodes chrysocephala]